ncbi:MAG: NAD(P)H-quinone oxidoreductase [Pseudomonadota bacterium]
MKVVEISEPGGAEVLCVADRDQPVPAADEVVIHIAWAGVNRPDVLHRLGLYRPPVGASDLPGLEASGEVVAIGAAVSSLAVGDRVCALFPGGAYAEYAKTPAAHCLPIPQGMSMRDAACLPETFFTVWSNVFQRGGLQAGEVLLVHGGSSGIGTTAIQLAHHFGARIIATAGSDAKCAACRALGADLAINYRDEDFVEVVKEDGGADVILDMVGGDYVARNLKCLKEDGRLVQIAFLQSSKVTMNLAPLMMRRQTITGSTLRPQSVAAKARIAEALSEHVWPLLDAGIVRPIFDSEFALEDAASAHRRMEASDHIGKIVLNVSDLT